MFMNNKQLLVIKLLLSVRHPFPYRHLITGEYGILGLYTHANTV